MPYEVVVKGIPEAQANLAKVLATLSNPGLMASTLFTAATPMWEMARNISPKGYEYPQPPWDKYPQGTLEDSIHMAPEMGQATIKISATAPYARHLEYGGPSVAGGGYPMHFIGVEGEHIDNVKIVNVAPHPFMRPAYDFMAADTVWEFAKELMWVLAEELGV